MKAVFKLKKVSYVVNVENFLQSLNHRFNSKYFLSKIINDEKFQHVFINFENVKEVVFQGTDLIYYQILFNDGRVINLSEENLKNNSNFLRVHLLENDTLVKLDSKEYNYMNYVTNYSVYRFDELETFDIDEDYKEITGLLMDLWKTKVEYYLNHTKDSFSLNYLKDQAILTINRKVYYVNSKHIVRSENGFLFVFIEDNCSVIILQEKTK